METSSYIYPTTFDLSDLLYFGDGYSINVSDSTDQHESINMAIPSDNDDDLVKDSSNMDHHGGSEVGRGGMKVDVGLNIRVAFRTRTEIDVLDDGFKRRKYGKKQVKNSPNPRNYYKCSTSGCPVKKRVERDPVDGRYVITTYEGIHNRESPSNADRFPGTSGQQMPVASPWEMHLGYHINH